ncbi:MAG TPA: DinB family protein [Bacteroidia bacterium]|jgi:hypothetical protein|nr:DinB family protein [Bacteroidia bacterium]
MINEIINQLDFNYVYAKQLVSDIPEDKMAFKPGPGLDNHPAFTLGHLATACANLTKNLTGEFKLPEKWQKLFMRTGPGDPTLPEPDPAAYPTKEELMKELNNQHERLIAFLLKADTTRLEKEFEWRFASYFPTYLDRIMFISANHYAMHLGQLAAWRRAMGMPSALGSIE